MPESEPDPRLDVPTALAAWWRQQRESNGITKSVQRLLAIVYAFLRDSLPDRRRQRYGDVDYDWEYRVNTTSAAVTWRTRLLGLFNSPYQPIPPEQFREIMAVLSQRLAPGTDFSQFTFLDIGAGKGRALLLASEFGFRRIIGVELLPELIEVARENVAQFEKRGMSSRIELVCQDATDFIFPAEEEVIFLFNPLPRWALRTLIQNLEQSLRQSPRDIYLVYANPTHQDLIADCGLLVQEGGIDQCCLLFRNSGG